jgi:hypothetical protein
MTVKHSLIISFFILLFTGVVISRDVLAQTLPSKNKSPLSIWDQLNADDRNLFNQIYSDVKKKIASEFSDEDLENDVIRGKNGEIIKLAGVAPNYNQGGDSNLPVFSSSPSTNLTKPPFKTPTVSSSMIALATQTQQSSTSTPETLSSSPSGTSESVIPVVNPEPVVVATPAPTPAPVAVIKPKRVQPKVTLAAATTKTQALPAGGTTEPKVEAKSEVKQDSKPQEAPKQEQKEEKKHEEPKKENEHKKDK